MTDDAETTKYVERAANETAEIAVFLWLIEPRSRSWLDRHWFQHFNRPAHELDTILVTLRDEGLIAVFKSRDGESYWYRRDNARKEMKNGKATE